MAFVAPRHITHRSTEGLRPSQYRGMGFFVLSTVGVLLIYGVAALLRVAIPPGSLWLAIAFGLAGTLWPSYLGTILTRAIQAPGALLGLLLAGLARLLLVSICMLLLLFPIAFASLSLWAGTHFGMAFAGFFGITIGFAGALTLVIWAGYPLLHACINAMLWCWKGGSHMIELLLSDAPLAPASLLRNVADDIQKICATIGPDLSIAPRDTLSWALFAAACLLGIVVAFLLFPFVG